MNSRQRRRLRRAIGRVEDGIRKALREGWITTTDVRPVGNASPVRQVGRITLHGLRT